MSTPTDLDSLATTAGPTPEEKHQPDDGRPLLPDSGAEAFGDGGPPEEDGEWDEDDGADESLPEAGTAVEAAGTPAVRRRKRRRQPRLDSPELKLRGRRALCKRIEDIAPLMLKTVKLRVLSGHLQSVRGLDDDDLTRVLRDDAGKLADPARVLAALAAPDPDFARGQLKAMVLNVLLQEETDSLPEHRLDAKVIEFEQAVVERSRSLDLTELRKGDPNRWHDYDTYRVVLDAAWADDNAVSPGEARLLAVLRTHLNISLEEHWLISALLKRFPKNGCELHTPDEVNEARKELQRQGVLWSYRNEDNQNIDVIPAEVSAVVRRDYAGLELQAVNYRRLMSHDAILLSDLREALSNRGLDRSGNKAELIARIAGGAVRPSDVLADLDRDKLSAMCGGFRLRSSGPKAELITRLVEFYDDLTFVERETKDEREALYADYELLAGRAYAELRAKKVITRDLDIQSLFEDATAFLFEVRLKAACDPSRKENRADGRIRLDRNQCLLWDCKSAETTVNLQDHLDGQFDGYLHRERAAGVEPLAFLVVGPAFTPLSIRLANQYKAQTNWDVALVQADALKHLADRWAAIAPDKPFPARLLVRTEVIDKDRAEFLLSLA